MHVIITGANGHLGKRLIQKISNMVPVTALVRRTSAQTELEGLYHPSSDLNIRKVDFENVPELREAMSNGSHIVHLIGTIKETQNNPLEKSHEHCANAVCLAAEELGIGRLVYVSIIGANPDSPSICLRRRSAVETIFSNNIRSTDTLRIPMVLGENDRASRALSKRARAKIVTLFRGSSLEQPIYAGDVVDAIWSCLNRPSQQRRLFELAGPETITRKALVRKAGQLINNDPNIISLPLFFGMAFAQAAEILRKNPVVTRDMLKILDHDDNIDCSSACSFLEIELTSLEEILKRCL